MFLKRSKLASELAFSMAEVKFGLTTDHVSKALFIIAHGPVLVTMSLVYVKISMNLK